MSLDFDRNDKKMTASSIEIPRRYLFSDERDDSDRRPFVGRKVEWVGNIQRSPSAGLALYGKK